MASLTLSIQFPTSGLNALQAQIALGVATRITQVQLTEQTLSTPGVWNPSVYYREDNPNVTGMTKLFNSTDPTTLENILVADLYLDETIPLAINYTAGTGWVGNPGHALTYIDLLNFCLFIEDPNTSTNVPFVIGTFLNPNTASPTPVYKYSNYNTAGVPGNILDIFNDMQLSPVDVNTLDYNISQYPQAQLVYKTVLATLPVPTVNTANAYAVLDTNGFPTIATTDFTLWYFTDYNTVSTTLSATYVNTTTFTSAALVAAVPYNFLDTALTDGSLIVEVTGDSGGTTVSNCYYITYINSSTNQVTINPETSSNVLVSTLTSVGLFIYGSNSIPYATTTTPGVVELSTNPEAIARTSTTVVLTPSNLNALFPDIVQTNDTITIGTTSGNGIIQTVNGDTRATMPNAGTSDDTIATLGDITASSLTWISRDGSASLPGFGKGNIGAFIYIKIISNVSTTNILSTMLVRYIPNSSSAVSVDTVNYAISSILTSMNFLFANPPNNSVISSFPITSTGGALSDIVNVQVSNNSLVIGPTEGTISWSFQGNAANNWNITVLGRFTS